MFKNVKFNFVFSIFVDGDIINVIIKSNFLTIVGHNSDGKYFVTSTKLGFACETKPKRIMFYIEKGRDGHTQPVEDVEIREIACGTNHIVVVDSKKRAFSWGFGGYGRLGHAETKDEMLPRLIKFFDAQGRGVKSVYCGNTFSIAVTDVGKEPYYIVQLVVDLEIHLSVTFFFFFLYR
jgi:hypothetical protein